MGCQRPSAHLEGTPQLQSMLRSSCFPLTQPLQSFFFSCWPFGISMNFRTRVPNLRALYWFTSCQTSSGIRLEIKVHNKCNALESSEAIPVHRKIVFHEIGCCSVALLQLHGLYPARLLCPWDFPGKNTGVGCHSLSLGKLPDLEIEPGSPALQVDSLPAEL